MAAHLQRVRITGGRRRPEDHRYYVKGPRLARVWERFVSQEGLHGEIS